MRICLPVDQLLNDTQLDDEELDMLMNESGTFLHCVNEGRFVYK